MVHSVERKPGGGRMREGIGELESRDGSQAPGRPVPRASEVTDDGFSTLRALVDSLDASVVVRLASLAAVAGEVADEVILANRELVVGAARAAGEAAQQVGRMGEPPSVRTLMRLARDRHTRLGFAFALHLARELGRYLEARAQGFTRAQSLGADPERGRGGSRKEHVSKGPRGGLGE